MEHHTLMQCINIYLVFGLQVALLLIRHGADVDVEDKEGYTVLGRATDEFRPILIDAAKTMLEWYKTQENEKIVRNAIREHCAVKETRFCLRPVLCVWPLSAFNGLHFRQPTLHFSLFFDTILNRYSRLIFADILSTCLFSRWDAPSPRILMLLVVAS